MPKKLNLKYDLLKKYFTNYYSQWGKSGKLAKMWIPKSQKFTKISEIIKKNREIFQKISKIQKKIQKSLIVKKIAKIFKTLQN